MAGEEWSTVPAGADIRACHGRAGVVLESSIGGRSGLGIASHSVSMLPLQLRSPSAGPLLIQLGGGMDEPPAAQLSYAPCECGAGMM